MMGGFIETKDGKSGSRISMVWSSESNSRLGAFSTNIIRWGGLDRQDLDAIAGALVELHLVGLLPIQGNRPCNLRRDNARLLVAQAYVNHIVAKPDDTLAKFLLMNLIYTENLHRPGGYYGNEALGAEQFLRTRFFLPEEEDEADE